MSRYPTVTLHLDFSAEETVSHLRECRCKTSRQGCIAARWIADQIEAQTAPPKPTRIPEPGLYGVVKASLNGKATGETDWVHLISGWYRGADDGARTWSALQNPTLVREGLS